MQLTPSVHLVASGLLGLGLTDRYDCNAYVVDTGAECALVDCGAGHRIDRVVGELERAVGDPARVTDIFLTHKHADHSGGAAELKRLTGATVHASRETADAVADGERFNAGLERARRSGGYPADYVFLGLDVDDVVRGGDTRSVGHLELRVLETPGHCAGHCSFVLEADGLTHLFTGDALLPGGQIVLQPIPDCSIPQTVASVEALADIGPDTLLSGHLAPVLGGGRSHVELALARIRAGRLPEQLAVPDLRQVG